MPDVSLSVREGVAAGQEISLARELTLGRDPESGFEVDDPGVSRRHATIEVGPEQALISDTRSANGTYVNGERIEQATALADGDVIQLGATVLDVAINGGATAVLGAGAATQASPAPAEAEAPPPPPARAERLPPPLPPAEPPRPALTPRREAPPRRVSGAPVQPRPQQRRLPEPTRGGSNWQAIAAVVLGPLSILFLVLGSGLLFYLALPAAVAAIGLGSAGKRRSDRRDDSLRGLAVAGQVFGVVGTILATIVILILLAVTAATDIAADNLTDLIDDIRTEIESEVDSATELPFEIPENLPDVQVP